MPRPLNAVEANLFLLANERRTRAVEQVTQRAAADFHAAMAPLYDAWGITPTTAYEIESSPDGLHTLFLPGDREAAKE